MELKKVLTPWNWFKKEEEQSRNAQSQVLSTSRGNPVLRLHHEIDQLFNDFFRGFPVSPFSRENPSLWGSSMLPQVDIAESSKEYTITVDVPGVEEKDIELTLSDGTLTILGEKRYEQEGHDRQYHRVERSYGSFQRVISLPDDADESEVRANFKNGVLTIIVRKNVNAKASSRKIPVNG